MCAGDQHRWVGDEPKQLVKVFGELLLLRMMRQLRERGFIGIAITHRSEIAELVSWIPGARYPDFDGCLNQTIGHSQTLWAPPHVRILLGDVIFPNDILHRILTDTDPISVWGRSDNDELFALTFAWEKKEHVIDVLNRCIPGRLAQFYRVLCGFHFNEPRYENVIFKDLRDSWTTDFDVVETYQDFLERFKDENSDSSSSVR